MFENLGTYYNLMFWFGKNIEKGEGVAGYYCEGKGIDCAEPPTSLLFNAGIGQKISTGTGKKLHDEIFGNAKYYRFSKCRYYPNGGMKVESNYPQYLIQFK